MSFVADSVSATAWAVRVREGDLEKQQALSEYLRAVLYRRFTQLGLNREDAVEMTQDCLFDVLANISRFDESKASIVTWVSGFARTSLKSYRRRESSRLHNEVAMDESMEFAQNDDALDDVDCAVRTCLGGLNALDQELLMMRFSYGMSFEEIAQRTDMTDANCRKRVSRAVDKLRKDPSLRSALGL